ncbi:MAG: phage minor capsid protein [Clostridia bacterium]|nr:phage minor capsid protein [Clostridia bacterium]
MKVIEELEDSIIKDMSRRIVKMGNVSDTTAWQAEVLQQSGMLYDDIVKRVSETTELLEEEIRGFYDDAETEVFNYDTVVLKDAGIDSEEFRRFSPDMTLIWKAALAKTCTDAINLTKTTALASQASFISACDLAMMQVSSGAFSYDQAIANAIKKVANTGGRVSYPSGKSDRIDVAVRRAVLTGVNQTSGQVMKMQAERLGYDLMEISAHTGARPEHSTWQGRIVSLSGNTHGGKYLTLDDIGYGTVTGFQGVNCRHTWWIFFEGVSKPLYTKDGLDAMAQSVVPYDGNLYYTYEARDMQRAMERKIRSSKRTLVALDEGLKAADNEELRQCLKTDFAAESVKLKQREAMLRDFCDQTGLRLDNSRTQVYNVFDDNGSVIGGFGKSVGQKAVATNKKEAEKYTKRLYNSDGTLYVTDNWIKRKHPTIPREYKPYAVIETKEVKGPHIQYNRTLYDDAGVMSVQIHSSHHNSQKDHPFGENGEHKHIYTYEGDTRKNRTDDELDEQDRKENADIL